MNFLDEIKKNAGIIEQTELKIDKGIYSGTNKSYMFEMAMGDMTQAVVNALKDGDAEKAASLYKGKTRGIGVTVKNFLKANQGLVDVKVLIDFVKKVNPAANTSELEYTEITGEVSNLERKKRKGSTDPRGEIITASQSSSKTLQKGIDKLYKIRRQVYNLAKQAEEMGEEEKERNLVSNIEALDVLIQSAEAIKVRKKGFNLSDESDDEKLNKLKERYNTIASRYKEKFGKEFVIPDLEVSTEEDEFAPMDDDERSEIMKKWHKRIAGERGKDPWAKWAKEKAEEDLQKESFDPDSKISLKQKILSESLEYSGNNFWKNYLGTHIIKGFVKDYKTLKESTVFYYTSIFGINTLPLFETLESNVKTLEKVMSKDPTFLFEEYAFNIEGINEGVLGDIWSKVKNFGMPVISFLANKVEWAKEIAKKGITYLAGNPMASTVIPAVVMTGSILGAMKLINSLRKKKGGKGLSKQEKEKIRRLAIENSDEIKKYSKPSNLQGKKVVPKEPIKSTDIDDEEEELLSDED